ncbi:MAG: pilus assembly protein CpaB [Saprospiraceae bacterium]
MAVKESKRRNRKGGLLRSSLGIFIVAILIGLLAAGLASLYIKLKGDAYLASLKGVDEVETSVVVATADLQPGTIISGANMSVRSMPVDFVHANAVSPRQFSLMDGKVLIEPMSQGSTLLRSFVDKEFADDFSDTLEIGRRAITMQVDELNAIGGLARPGNRIDIFVLLPPGSTDPADQRDMVIPVLQDLLVLAAGQETYGEYREKVLQQGRRPEDSFSNITVDVSPKEGALLTQAIDKGLIITLLRNRDDRGVASFAQILPVDLVKNAQEMVKRYQEGDKFIVTEDGIVMTADGRVMEGMTVTKDGFLVDENGNIMTKDGIILEGVTLNENGEVVTADGTVLKESEIVVNKDGTIGISNTKTLIGVTAVKDASQLEGATLTKDGFYVTADGTILTKDGYVLEGVTLNENGEVVAADGTILKANEVTINEDGSVSITKIEELDGVAGVDSDELPDNVTVTKGGFLVDENGNIMTKDGVILKGVTLNENGEVVTADGTVLTESEIVVNEDGSIAVAKTKTLDGVTAVKNASLLEGATLTKDGFYVTADGTILTKDGYVLEGVTLNENGEVVTADGTILKADEITINEDGSVSITKTEALDGVTGIDIQALLDGATLTKSGFYVTEDGRVMTKDGLIITGATVNANGDVVDADGNILKLSDYTNASPAGESMQRLIEFIAGGVSEGGKAKVTKLPILK